MSEQRENELREGLKFWGWLSDEQIDGIIQTNKDLATFNNDKTVDEIAKDIHDGLEFDGKLIKSMFEFAFEWIKDNPPGWTAFKNSLAIKCHCDWYRRYFYAAD